MQDGRALGNLPFARSLITRSLRSPPANGRADPRGGKRWIPGRLNNTHSLCVGALPRSLSRAPTLRLLFARLSPSSFLFSILPLERYTTSRATRAHLSRRDGGQSRRIKRRRFSTRSGHPAISNAARHPQTRGEILWLASFYWRLGSICFNGGARYYSAASLWGPCSFSGGEPVEIKTERRQYKQENKSRVESAPLVVYWTVVPAAGRVHTSNGRLNEFGLEVADDV